MAENKNSKTETATKQKKSVQKKNTDKQTKTSKKKQKSIKMLMNTSIIAPLATEKAIMMVDTQNTLVFYVQRNARKEKIKKDVEDLLNVKVDDVRTTITMKGKKKAYVKINDEYLASDLAGRLGMM